MRTFEELQEDAVFVARIRLSEVPPECPRCGQPGEWVRHGPTVDRVVVHWVCSCPFCKWEAMVAETYFLVGIPQRANQWDLWGDPEATLRELPLSSAKTREDA